MKAGWGARPPLSEEELIRLQQAPEWARIELARQAAAAGQAPETLTPWQRAQLEQQERQWAAQQLAGPGSWIERWFYENMPQRQPWMREEAGPIWERAVPGQVPTGYSPVPVTGGVAYVAPGEELERHFELPERAFGAGQPSEVAAREEAGLPAHIVSWGFPSGGGGEPPRPQAPPAPPWLPKFVPQLQTGEEIRKLPSLTLSGQQAQQVSPTEWQGLGGYLGWAGVPGQAASLQDYVARMEAMFPSRQATRPRWGTRRSYV